MESFSRGLTEKKWNKISGAVLDCLHCKNGRMDFEPFVTLVHRMAWWSRVLLWLRPFLKKSYAEIARVRNVLEAKSAKLGVPLKRLTKCAYILKHRVQQDFATWVWVLEHRKMTMLPDPLLSVHKIMIKGDAYGTHTEGGIAAWRPVNAEFGCDEADDYNNVWWCAHKFEKGEILGDVQPQKVISALECLAQLVGVDLFGEDFEGREFQIGTDSMVTKWSIGSLRCKSLPLLTVLRGFAKLCLERNYAPSALHTKGINNFIADGLSRFKKVVIELMDPKRRMTADVDGLLKDFTLGDVQSIITSWRREGAKA